MFNRSRFNKTLFNKYIPPKITVTLEGVSEFEFTSRLIYKGKAELSSETGFDITLRTIILNGTGEIQVTTKPALNGGAVLLDGIGELINPLYIIRADADSDISIKGYKVRYDRVDIEADSGITIRGARANYIKFAVDTTGELTITRYVNQKMNTTADLDGHGFTDNRSGYIIADVLILTESFAPGDEIIIDMENFLILKNGQNILNSMGDTSEFFNLDVGENTINYRDTAAARNVTAKVVHKDRYL